MSSTLSASASLAVTLNHAVTYLTSPLALRYSSATIKKLQASLQANLAATYFATWVPTEPLRGSGRRCLSLSPLCHPPRPVYKACAVASVQWADWIALLGGVEFDIFIDPGCVSVRFGKWGAGNVSKLITVWSDEIEAHIKAQAKAQVDALLQLKAQQACVQAPKPRKTLAQILVEQDAQDDEALFSMIADEVRAPTWMTPLLEQFPAIPKITISPAHSRSSSRSSMSSSGFSFSSQESLNSASSVASLSTSLSTDSCPSVSSPAKTSRRERARQARVFVDNTKVEVTPYDGGKTTVLTGGVMLGAPPASKTTGRKVRRA